ncbi:TonB-dependent receptor plug domain-containing protein [Mucilaginibacter boryungensis]|uniref:TonB-dependent receptor n=1 Tax=Mucilaginibacter boryungensis TaxID=768480 RepID=A0ABR9XGI9_9SPHI|nr:TonB-dependent receptor [Mucilaginibacter boryungensis]MBE9666315.1 TonB-dependent receptor [Mucilaginibacter boryungensis]
MKKNDVIVAAGLGLVQLALLSAAARAQDTSRVLQDVVITATKADQKQSQTGKVVTVISRQELQRSSGKSVSQLLAEQAGIMVNGSNANPGLNKSVYLRGADNKHTLILLDGVLIFDPSGVGGAFDLRLLSVDQIDHIEILRGGQSTLYGSDAVAGVINIITKKNAGATPGINGVASAGSYGTAKGNVGLTARVKDLSYNINYSHERSDGVSEAAQPATATSFFDKDGYNQDAVNAQFGIKLSDRFQLNPFVRFLQGKYSYDNGGFTDGDGYFTSKHLNLGTNATYKTDKGLFNLNYSFENTDRNYNGTSPFIGRLNFTELYYKHQLSDHIKILGGIDDRYSSMNAKGNARVDSSANSLGVYTSVFFNNIASVFNLEAGGRYTHHTKFGNNWTYSVTPSVDLIANDKLKVFGTISTSFKAPDLGALYGLYGPNPNLKPEKAQEYEAGASTALFGNFNLRVVAYQRKLTNAIIYLYPQGYLNQDKQNAKGIEVEPSVKLDKLTLRGYYTYFKAEAISKNGAGAEKSLDFLYRRPAHNFGLFAGLQASQKLFVSLNYRHYSQTYDLFYNSKTFANELQSLKAYGLLDGYAEYALIGKKLKVFADVKNILNAKYAELYGYTALGTNFNAGLSFNIQ